MPSRHEQVAGAHGQGVAAPSHGYVPLQQTPYRGHQLLVDAVLTYTKPGDLIFEGGVSSGYLAAILVQEGRRVHGAELDPLAASEAEAVCDRVFVGDLSNIDTAQFAREYNVILFGDTLEHLPDPPAVLGRLRPHLRDEGVLILSIPNVANWAIRLGLLFGRFRYTDRGILDRTHLRFYTRRTLTEMLDGAGFDVVALTASVPVPLVKSLPVLRLVHRIGNLRPSFFAYGFIVVARPRPYG